MNDNQTVSTSTFVSSSEEIGECRFNRSSVSIKNGEQLYILCVGSVYRYPVNRGTRTVNKSAAVVMTASDMRKVADAIYNSLDELPCGLCDGTHRNHELGCMHAKRES